MQIEHVSYKGTAPALTDLLGGHVPLLVADLPAPLPHVKSGKLRALAVTGERRSALLPEVATSAEQGFKGLQATNWLGVMAPVKTPPALLERLPRVRRCVLLRGHAREIRRVGATPNHRNRVPLRRLCARRFTRLGESGTASGDHCSNCNWRMVGKMKDIRNAIDHRRRRNAAMSAALVQRMAARSVVLETAPVGERAHTSCCRLTRWIFNNMTMCARARSIRGELRTSIRHVFARGEEGGGGGGRRIFIEIWGVSINTAAIPI